MTDLSKTLFEMGVSLVRAQAEVDRQTDSLRADVSREIDGQTFPCRGCGKETLNFGDFPYCSYLCKWTTKDTEAKQ